MLPSAVSEHYQAQQRLIVSTLALTRREWSTMDPVDLEASWAKVGPRVNLLTTAGQLGAARNGAGYVAATLLGDYGEDVVSRGVVNPRAFAGIASDGRPLDTLLDGALYRAKGMNLESGGKWLDMAVHTQIADAGRASAATAIASYDDVGWVRMVNPPCCGPCAVLSGKEFRYNQGFERHPRCDCVHIPSTLANPADNMGVNPALDQIMDLTDAERKALEEGADLPQVINARRGRSRDKMSTTEGTARDRSRRRLTPDGIFAQAKNRDEALALLRQNGYLSEYGRAVRLQPWTQVAARPVKKVASYVDEIAAAKTPADVGATLQRILGDRGVVTGFGHPTIAREKAVKIATQVARMAEKYPQVNFDVLVEEVKNKLTFAAARRTYGKDGAPDTYALVLSRSKLTARSKADELFTKSVDAGWWRVAEGVDADPWENMISHEFGHLIDYVTGNYDASPTGGFDAAGRQLASRRISAGGNAIRLAKEKGLVQPAPYFQHKSPRVDPVKLREYNEWTDFMESQISGYGRTNHAEGIAEAFADVETNGALATATSKATVSQLLALLKAMS